MDYTQGDKIYEQFVTFNSDGISTNADTVPWATLVHNGVDDRNVHLTVTNVDVGRYNIVGVFPAGYSYGSSVHIAISGLMNGNLGKSIIKVI